MSTVTVNGEAVETGCALDGHYGWHNTYRVTREIAVPAGFEISSEDDKILTAYEEGSDGITVTLSPAHVWQTGRFTGNRTCQLCGLLPLDPDDDESPCERYMDAGAIGQAASEIADEATDYLSSVTDGGYWAWDVGELFLWADDNEDSPYDV